MGAFLSIVSKLDYIALSTYPDISVSRKNNLKVIPSLREKYGIPVGISETGISSRHYNFEERKVYIQNVFNTLVENEAKFLIWGSVIDPVTRIKKWSNTLGLLDHKGTQKPEFIIWKKEALKFRKCAGQKNE